MTGLGRWLGAWPGRLETPGHVKRRLLVVSVVGALTLGGAYAVTTFGPDTGPFTPTELRECLGSPSRPGGSSRTPTAPTGSSARGALQLEQLQRSSENSRRRRTSAAASWGPSRRAPKRIGPGS